MVVQVYQLVTVNVLTTHPVECVKVPFLSELKGAVKVKGLVAHFSAMFCSMPRELSESV